MHIFLTGEIQVGKSTAIRRFLANTDTQADGFLSHIVSVDAERPELGRNLHLARFDTEIGETDSVLAASNAAASQSANGFAPFTVYTEVFDTRGAELVRSAGRHGLILMDELGRMEEDAAEFKRAVFERLDGDVPILGVVKMVQTPFLDAVRAHPCVTVVTVTQANRDDVPRLIREMLK